MFESNNLKDISATIANIDYVLQGATVYCKFNVYHKNKQYHTSKYMCIFITNTDFQIPADQRINLKSKVKFTDENQAKQWLSNQNDLSNFVKKSTFYY